MNGTASTSTFPRSHAPRSSSARTASRKPSSANVATVSLAWWREVRRTVCFGVPARHPKRAFSTGRPLRVVQSTPVSKATPRAAAWRARNASQSAGW